MEESPRTDNNRTVPIPDVRSEGSVSEVAQSCIDEIAEVTQLVVSPPSSHNTPTPGTRVCGSKAGDERSPSQRTSDVVWDLPYSPNVI